MSEFPIGGWLHDREDRAFLASLQDETPVLAMRGLYREVTFDPRDVIRVEDQGQQGACQGHGITNVCEWVHCIATGDTSLQLSRAMGYYETQRLDGLSGDKGSTIANGVKLARMTGIAEERLWPYPPAYDPARPRDYGQVLANASRYKIGREINMSTYEGVRTFLGSGQGGISIGIMWGDRMNAPVVESYSPGRGGHAIALLSLSNRKDNQGRPYVWMINSWGERFGNGGWAEWSPAAVEAMLRHRDNAAVGLSDMPEAKPRTYSLEQWKRVLHA